MLLLDVLQFGIDLLALQRAELQNVRETADALSVLSHVGFPKAKYAVHFVKKSNVLIRSHFELVGQALFHCFEGLKAFSNVSNRVADLGEILVQSLEI